MQQLSLGRLGDSSATNRGAAIPDPVESSRHVAPSAREAASEGQAAIDSTGPARRTAPGGDPTTRLNARANAASER